MIIYDEVDGIEVPDLALAVISEAWSANGISRLKASRGTSQHGATEGPSIEFEVIGLC